MGRSWEERLGEQQFRMPRHDPVSSGAQSAGRRIRSARRSGGAACSSNFVSLQFCAVMGALMPTRATRPIVLLCFFASGVAGLIYEVVWGKYLALLLGHTAQAHTIVLATFMGGLALGNYAFGRLADEVWPHQAPWPRPLAGHRGRAQYRGWRDRVRKKNEEPEGVKDVPGLKQVVENVGDRDAQATNARLAATFSRLDRDSIQIPHMAHRMELARLRQVRHALVERASPSGVRCWSPHVREERGERPVHAVQEGLSEVEARRRGL